MTAPKETGRNPNGYMAMVIAMYCLSMGGVQTFMWMTEDDIVEVPFDKEHLLEVILSPDNLNEAYKAVVRNKGCGGIDKMSCEQLLP